MADAGQRQQDRQRAQARDRERGAFGADHRAQQQRAVPNAAMHSTCSVDAAPGVTNRLRTACASGRGCRPRSRSRCPPQPRPSIAPRQRGPVAAEQQPQPERASASPATKAAPMRSPNSSAPASAMKTPARCPATSPARARRSGCCGAIEPQVGGERYAGSASHAQARAGIGFQPRCSVTIAANIAPASAIRQNADTVGGKPLRRTIRPLLPIRQAPSSRRTSAVRRCASAPPGKFVDRRRHAHAKA